MRTRDVAKYEQDILENFKTSKEEDLLIQIIHF